MDAKVTITQKGLERLCRPDNDLTENELRTLAEIRTLLDQGFNVTTRDEKLEKLGYIEVERFVDLDILWLRGTPKPVYDWDERTNTYKKKIEKWGE